jgi:predicted amidohydrolase YtcJ
MSGLFADHVLLGGRVRTLDAQGTEAEAIALRGDAIVAIGTDAEVLQTIGPSTQVAELRGRTVLPGLTDAHVHLASDASRAVGAVECRDFYDSSVRSVSDVLERIGNAARAAAPTPGSWIHGRASPLQDMRMAEGRLPTRQELDAVAPSNPVAIAFGPHVTLANPAALAARGITSTAASPASRAPSMSRSMRPMVRITLASCGSVRQSWTRPSGATTR